MSNWQFKYHAAQSLYEQRIEEINRNSETITQPFLGSLGAVDGTYSVRPRILRYANNFQTDPLYTDYHDIHGYKLLVLTSHGLGDCKKLILRTSVGPGSASDANMFIFMNDEMKEQGLHKNASFLGDNAFHQSNSVIVPCHQLQINCHADKQSCYSFNHTMSSSRVTAEHGIGYLKSWGMIRGRSDIKLIDKSSVFKEVVKSIQGIHNYCALN